VVEIRKTPAFDAWLSQLRDNEAVARIGARIDRLISGNPGDVRPVGSGVSEMRVNYGPGYRVYYIRRGNVVIVLLCGGNKSSQANDIQQARRLAERWRE
jgi:putative addiction module killer protein